MGTRRDCRIAVLGLALGLMGGAARGGTADSDAGDLIRRVTPVVAGFCQKFSLDIAPIEKSGIEGTSSNAVVTVPLRPDREASFTVDLNPEEVVFFSTMKTLSRKRYAGRRKVGEPEAVALAGAALARLGINTNCLREPLVNRFCFSKNSTQEVARFFWPRQAQGFRFKDDYVSLLFDAQDGELLSFKKMWGASPKIFRITISLEAAREAAARHLSKTASAPPIIFRSAEVCVVSPNTFLATCPSDPGRRRLAWVFEAPKQPGLDKASGIWVDAATGEVLGGEELF